MQLPDALKPWQSWLDWFSEEQAMLLGDLLTRLEALIGNPAGLYKELAEPEGYGELRRRGSYERLLSSEWALADLIPEEFLRRAVTGEHLFLAPAEARRPAAGSLIALFDSGPWQLGAPRLAHLALWILLARRASRHGLQFRWGLLQHPGTLHEGDSPEQLRLLLTARSLTVVTEGHWQDWQSDLDPRPDRHEIWACTQPDAVLPGWVHHTVATIRSLDAPVLELSFRSGGQHRHSRLSLPAQAPALRLLRGEFHATAHAGMGPKLSGPLQPLILPTGGIVAFPLTRGGVLSIRLSRRQKRTHPVHRWSNGQRPLGLIANGKQVGALLEKDGQLVFWRVENVPSTPHLPAAALRLPADHEPWLQTFWLKGNSEIRIYVLDRQGELYYWSNDARSQTQSLTSFADSVIGIELMTPQMLVYARPQTGQIWIHRLQDLRMKIIARLPLPAVSGPVFFAGGVHWQHGQGVWAMPCEGDDGDKQHWRIHQLVNPNHVPDADGNTAANALRLTDIALPRNLIVCGLILDATRQAQPALIAMDNQRQRILLTVDGILEQLLHDPSGYACLTVSGANNLLALSNNHRQLSIYSTAERKTLWSDHAVHLEAQHD